MQRWLFSQSREALTWHSRRRGRRARSRCKNGEQVFFCNSFFYDPALATFCGAGAVDMPEGEVHFQPQVGAEKNKVDGIVQVERNFL